MRWSLWPDIWAEKLLTPAWSVYGRPTYRDPQKITRLRDAPAPKRDYPYIVKREDAP